MDDEMKNEVGNNTFPKDVTAVKIGNPKMTNAEKKAIGKEATMVSNGISPFLAALQSRAVRPVVQRTATITPEHLQLPITVRGMTVKEMAQTEREVDHELNKLGIVDETSLVVEKQIRCIMEMIITPELKDPSLLKKYTGCDTLRQFVETFMSMTDIAMIYNASIKLSNKTIEEDQESLKKAVSEVGE